MNAYMPAPRISCLREINQATQIYQKWYMEIGTIGQGTSYQVIEFSVTYWTCRA